MVKCRVEADPVVRIAADDFYLAELAVPVLPCLRKVFVKVIVRGFCLKIEGRSLHSCAGKGRAHCQLFPF